MKRFRSYGFWTAFAGAVTMLLGSIGKCVGFSVNSELISEIIMAFAGLLVVLGVVIMPKKQDNNDENEKLDSENDNGEDEKQIEIENQNVENSQADKEKANEDNEINKD